MNLTTEQKSWLYALQRPWPLVQRPLEAIAHTLGTTETALIAFIQALRTAGYIRRIGGVFDARRLGYRSCLFGIHAPSNADLKRVSEAVTALPGVTHAYTRGWPKDLKLDGVTEKNYHAYPNFWYTLSAPATHFDETAAQLAAFNPIPFPALKRYKIDVVFDLRTRSRDERTEYVSPQLTAAPTLLNPAQQDIVRRYQDDTLNYTAPFRTEDLPQLQAWQADGTMRRFALLLYHRVTGFMANGMCCWQVPIEAIDHHGRLLAAQPEVTHCYARPENEKFPFTLYAMIHNTSWKAAYDTFNQLTRRAELDSFARKIFFSTHEYKKSSLRFFI